jgi:hypothetical protein
LNTENFSVFSIQGVMVMKLSLIAGLSTLLITAAATPVVAKPMAVNPYVVGGNEATQQLSPSELVALANRGYLEKEGIPSYGVLSNQLQLGQVTAKDIVEAGVKANRLAANTVEDEAYINAVESQIRSVYIIR